MYQLHITGFCHSDLKLENILEKLGDFCICDYGLTEYYGYPRVIKDYQCTRYFKAPDKRISINVDLYGWGACLFYLFTGLSITFKDSLTELDVSLMENKLKKYLDNTSIEIIKRLISKENSRPTAKQLLIQYYNFTPKYTINNIDKLLETSISNNKDIDYNYDDGITTLDHVVFKSLKMKRTPYYQYSYNDLLNHRNFEIDYLDDTFAYYYNYHISTPQICSKKYRPIVNEILRQYFNTHLHMESLFLAIHIFNNINTELDLKVEDYHDFTKILMNYSCKYLEYHQYIINLSTLKKDDIFSLEKTIIKKMVDNHISFIPVTFNIYYYLTRLVQTMKLSYNYYFSNLESVCLSILTFFMINMPVGKKFNVHLVCLNILIHAIYFINNNELDTKSNFSGFIFKTVNLLEPAILNKIVEYSPFLEYLQKNLDK
jgi:serine/threonine protein kinase